MELNEERLRELLASPLADETVRNMTEVIEDGLEVRIVSGDRPTMTIRTKHFLYKYLAQQFKWPITPHAEPA